MAKKKKTAEETSYRWRSGTRVEGGLKAQDFGEFQAELGEEVEAKSALKIAASDKRVRHGFVWDNEEAGRRYREWEMRHYLAALQKVTYVEVEGQKEPQEIIAQVRIHVPKQQAYVLAECVAEKPEYKQSALDECLIKLMGLRRRYNEIEALQPVWMALDEVAEQRKEETKEEDDEDEDDEDEDEPPLMAAQA